MLIQMWSCSKPTSLNYPMKRSIRNCYDSRTEHEATVALVEHLAELAARRLHLNAGFKSLFEYCRVRLGLSEGEAYNRTVAARVVRRFPYVFSRLADGSINLTTVRILFKH